MKYTIWLEKILYPLYHIIPYKEYGDNLNYEKFMNKYNSDWDPFIIVD